MLLVTLWGIVAMAQQHRPAPHAPPKNRIHPPSQTAPGAPAPPGHARPPPPAPAQVPHEQAAPHEDEGAKPEPEESEAPAPINWIDFKSATPPFMAMVLNFGILVAAYYFFGKKPVAVALQNRRDSIAKDIEEARRMRAEAEERAKLYQRKLETVEEEVRLTKESLLRAGEAERERMLNEAEAKAERMRKDAEFLVEQEMKQVRADLLRETVEAAVAAAEQLLKSRVTAADQERIADDYLADLGARMPGAPASQGRPS
jgi:F-type H+-transporting ATPase subunit b